MFSHLKRSPAELASSKIDTDRRLAVVIGSDSQFDHEVLERARDMYGKMLRSGRARTQLRETRVDAGRAGSQKDGSHKGWMRKRKQAVDKAAQEEELRTPQRRRPPVELPESLAKEEAKQKALLRKRKTEAFLEGTLLDSEITDDLKDEAEKRKKVDEQNDRQRCKAYAAMAKSVHVAKHGLAARSALQNLPVPAFFLEGITDKTRLENQLRKVGVTAFVQARGHLTENCHYSL